MISAMELEIIFFSWKMKIKTVTEFIEKEKNNNQTVYYKTLSGHGHQKRKKKPSLIFFEVEV